VRNEKQINRRLLALRSAVDVMQELRNEMPQSVTLINQAMRQVTTVREAYEEQRRTLDELAEMPRKPPQRVMMRARRKQTARVTFPKRAQTEAEVGDYDMEAAKELEDTFGHDLPDGSD
jgi:hypothetical protein